MQMSFTPLTNWSAGITETGMAPISALVGIDELRTTHGVWIANRESGGIAMLPSALRFPNRELFDAAQEKLRQMPLLRQRVEFEFRKRRNALHRFAAEGERAEQ